MGQFKKFILAADLHGDVLDVPTVNAFHRFVGDFRPHHRIVLGDVFDLRALRGKASEDERRESMKADLADGFKFIEQFRPTAFLLGNHDRRLWEWRGKSAGPTSDYCSEQIERVESLAAKMRFPLLPQTIDEGVYRLGPANLLHGFYSGKSAVKQHAEVYGPCIFGHIHASEHVSLPGYRVRREAWSSPCLCRKAMEYNRQTPWTLRYDTGWLYGFVSDESIHVMTARVENGTVVVATDMKAVAA